MSREEIDDQPGRFKRSVRFVWRWSPHVASILATFCLAVGAVVLGGDDYQALSDKTLTWGWCLVGAGVALGAFATIVHGLREFDRTSLTARLHSAETRASGAEELVGALQRALQEGLRSRLLHVRDDLGIVPTTDFRISLYSHNSPRKCLVHRARFASDPRLEDVRQGRSTIPDDSGLIGQALAKKTVSVFTVNTQRVVGAARPAWENWMVTEGHVTATVAANLRMQTGAYMFAPIEDKVHGRVVGMLVVEFAKSNAAPTKAKLRDSITRRGRDLAVALAAVERELENTVEIPVQLTAEDSTGRA